MKSGAKVAIAAGGALAAVLAGYYAIKNVSAGQFILVTSAGPGGSISPSSVSGIYEPSGKIVNVVITANSGYTIGQVLQNGSPINTSTTDTSANYQITMNQDQEIDVVFFQGGQPPIGTAVKIVALNVQAIVWGYYGCKVGLGAANAISSVEIDTCDQNWIYGNYASNQQIQFKVEDSNGNGVPDIITNGQHSLQVALYPSLFPDASKYKGYLALNEQMTSETNPLILYPGSNGIVTVNLDYFCDPSALNQPYKLPYDAELYINALSDAIVPVSIAPYNGWFTGGLFIFTGKGGHGVTGQGPAAMGPMQPNTIIAQVVGTAIQEAICSCTCGFNIKML